MQRSIQAVSLFFAGFRKAFQFITTCFANTSHLIDLSVRKALAYSPYMIK